MNSNSNNNNNVSGIHYTSGCESGWTSYLVSSYYSENHRFEILPDDEAYRSRKEDQDDLSMISDASSGPPVNYNEDHHINEDYCSFSAQEFITKSEKKKIHIKERGFRNRHSYLDDTASSPVLISYPKKNIPLSRDGIIEENSHGFSATHYSKRNSKFKKHFGLGFSGKSTPEE